MSYRSHPQPLQVAIGFAFDWCMRILGPCLIVLALGLLGAVIYLFFAFLLPMAAGGEVGVLYFLHGSWGLFLSVNVLFNYFMCVTTNPGNPCEEGDVEAGIPDGQTRGLDSSALDPRSYGFCKKCRIPRPPR
jgi:hypothetical protein